MSTAAIHSESGPAPWAQDLAVLPVAFAQVREDPRLDLAVLRRLRAPADVVMIASGGDTLACIAREPLRSLTAVDVNAAQLALCRLKLHLAGTVSPAESQALLGHERMDPVERRRRLEDLLRHLELPGDIFGREDMVATLGPDHVGRYERLFARLRAELAPDRNYVLEMLHSAEIRRPPSAGAPGALESALGAALERVMALPNLVALFGAEATQNPRQAFHHHFMGRLQQGMAAHPPASNPFLWQMLEGTFAPGVCYDWLQSDAPAAVPVRYVLGRMSEVLATMPAESADFVHLSNILDWLGERDATECLRRAARLLRPGGAVLLRQLNSTLSIPELPSGLAWDGKSGAELCAQDRSFFYHAIHVGYRP
jgi:S-adenosylmethionine-diacylglycerol 3-amino-3-carboxypropyl transferase